MGDKSSIDAQIGKLVSRLGDKHLTQRDLADIKKRLTYLKMLKAG